MTLRTPLILASAGLLALAACDPYPQGNPDNVRTRTGATTGALIGGAIGATSNSSERVLATVAGAAVGAAVGGAIGQHLDRQAADLRQSIGNPDVSVVNTGDTLVVTTSGFQPQHRILGATEKLTVTERFERVSDSEILYTFTMEDPDAYAQPWTGELMFNARPKDEKIFEYACHEGNYALPGVLAGARMAEAEAAQQQ